MICLVGARSGSKRIPGKNTKLLGGRPLLVYTLHAAFDADCFSHVCLSTDSQEIASTALDWCGKSLEVIIRPAHMAEDDSPDIEWLRHAWSTYEARIGENGWHKCQDCWDRSSLHRTASGGTPLYRCPTHELATSACILRPTSPFRDADTIHRALQLWEDIGEKFTSLRSIRRVSEHPNKMWEGYHGSLIVPWANGLTEPQEGWNSPTQSLPPVYIQTGGLEIHHRSTISEGSISGDRVAGFIVEGSEALDLNSPEDWERAEALANQLLGLRAGI